MHKEASDQCYVWQNLDIDFNQKSEMFKSSQSILILEYLRILKFSCFWCALPGLRQFLTNGGLLKMMKNTFYFILIESFCSPDI